MSEDGIEQAREDMGSLTASLDEEDRDEIRTINAFLSGLRDPEAILSVSIAGMELLVARGTVPGLLRFTRNRMREEE